MGHDALQEVNAGTCTIQAFPELERRNSVDKNVQSRVAKSLLESLVKYLAPFLDPTVTA